jgi:hypothetical protein
VGGAGAETYGYDAIGRLIDHSSDLGDFGFSYLGETSQPTERQLAGSTFSTSWSYLPNSGDRRLSGISNVGLSSGQYSTYSYTTTPEKFITAISETSDSPPVYPTPGTQTASYNNLNQLTGLSGQALTYDADGNLLSDGQRDFSWDAENRLIGITYPGAPGKSTVFACGGFKWVPVNCPGARMCPDREARSHYLSFQKTGCPPHSYWHIVADFLPLSW